MLKVFVNGCFDILHTGHLELLSYAKSLGDYLLVALDTDERIKETKGLDRPFNNLVNRVAIMSFLKPVDEVKYFGSDAELRIIIKEYQPDIMIVGSDYKYKTVIGSEYTKKLEFYERVNDESTTKTIQSYIDRRCMYR